MSTITMLEIESRMAGFVIGRGGSKINSIQEETGTVIKILDCSSIDTKKVKILGTEEAQKKAVSIIQGLTNNIMNVETITMAASNIKPRKKRVKQRQSSPPERIVLSDEVWEEIRRENEETQRLLMESLPKIVKEFYVEHEEIKSMSMEAVEAFKLAKNNIMVEYVEGANKSKPIPKPIIKFEHVFHAYPEILQVIKKQKFTEPSPIQCQAWPVILSGHDLIAIAQTGTGKTLAFILPALIHLERQPTPRSERIGPSVLILAPTRELALQIEEEIKKYTFNGINVLCVYGGVSIKNQRQRILDEKPDIVVGTPGRLVDLVPTGNLKVDHVSYLVFDEADRMLDMGFKNQIEIALMNVRPDRQTIMTSATWPKSVLELAEQFAKDIVHITIGNMSLTSAITVKQEIIVIKQHEKETWLVSFLKKLSKTDKVIIFMRKKIFVDNLRELLETHNIVCR